MNTDKLTSELCKYLLDVVVIDSKFKWIFARTHEEYQENGEYYFGPYFYEKTVDKPLIYWYYPLCIYMF